MPVRKIKGASASSANVAPATAFAPYTGPAGIVRGLMKQLSVKTSKAGNDVFNFVVQVTEPEGSKLAAHNGQSAWGSQTVTDAGSQFVNGMFVGMGLPKADQDFFWAKGANLEKKDAAGNEKVISLGKFKIPAEGIPVVVNMKMGDSYVDNQGTQKEGTMKVHSFMVPGAVPSALPEVGDNDYVEPAFEDDAVASPEPEEEGSEEEAAEEEATEEAAEEEGEEEDDAFTARVVELQALIEDRVALKKIAGKVEGGHQLPIMKNDSNEDIINKILAFEFPPDEGAEEEGGEEPAVEETTKPAAKRSASKAAEKAKPAAVPAADDSDEPPF